MTIGGILRDKGAGVVAVGPEERLDAVARKLSAHRIGAVLVRDDAGAVIGILSERDLVRAIADRGEAALALPAAELMTRDVVTVGLSTSVQEAMEIMTDRRFRHLPVMDQGRLVGLVSIGDCVKARIAEAEQEAEALRSFVVAG
ncbi:MAG: CBS domain-containing protein [Acetobacteraceae bacterium]